MSLKGDLRSFARTQIKLKTAALFSADLNFFDVQLLTNAVCLSHSQKRFFEENLTFQFLHKLGRILFFFKKMGHSRSLFIYFRLFNTQLTVNKYSIYIHFC